ncbi:peptidylprolyl isomerase [Neokomagataea sp. TBRC 2177]|uniref:Peptidylprolyl isomerase n=2 Tax=Neokomagataea anthophila TaxID=2826925 RepID=A0ABS5E3Y3_9PROT|nr:peptidylprolyl isomerase [Neokomagataea anthophila]MBR0558611.1 peptidylprolyl isomerase [Neokomagataea anthophila]
MRVLSTLTAFLLSSVVAHAAAESPTDIIAHAPQSAWRTIPPEQLLLMTMGNGRHVLIALAPDFAPTHVANILELTRAHAWDAGAIIRVQENYVVQWRVHNEQTPPPQHFVTQPAAEYDRPLTGLSFHPLTTPDPYAPQAGFASEWAIGTDGTHAWPAQCYGTIGVARGMPPDTGDGRELYVINGEAPRQLDRNLAVVGRVLTGMENLNALPRGTGPLGFYTKPNQNMPIKNIKLVVDLPPEKRPRIQVMRTDSAAFDHYLAARAARTEAFFVHAAHGVALCNVPIPSREIATP